MRAVLIPADPDQLVQILDIPDPRVDIDGNLVIIERLCGVAAGGLDAFSFGQGELRGWIDDMGYFNKLPNPRATELRHEMWVKAGGRPDVDFGVDLHGNVVVLGPIMDEDDSDVPDWFVDRVRAGDFGDWLQSGLDA